MIVSKSTASLSYDSLLHFIKEANIQGLGWNPIWARIKLLVNQIGISQEGTNECFCIFWNETSTYSFKKM